MLNYYEQESERLILRKFQAADIESWTSFFFNNPNLKYLGLTIRPNKKEMSEYWINNQWKRYYRKEFGHLAIVSKKTNHLLGSCGMVIRELDGKEIHEIGYSFKPKYWGLGYATEAAQTLRDFGFKNEVAEEFFSIIHKDNHPSKKVALRNGMTMTKTTTYLEMPVEIYGIHRKDWEKIQ